MTVGGPFCAAAHDYEEELRVNAIADLAEKKELLQGRMCKMRPARSVADEVVAIADKAEDAPAETGLKR